jgi:hypothetical protein
MIREALLRFTFKEARFCNARCATKKRFLMPLFATAVGRCSLRSLPPASHRSSRHKMWYSVPHAICRWSRVSYITRTSRQISGGQLADQTQITGTVRWKVIDEPTFPLRCIAVVNVAILQPTLAQVDNIQALLLMRAYAVASQRLFQPSAEQYLPSLLPIFRPVGRKVGNTKT